MGTLRTAFRNLGRHPARTALGLAGIAVTAAMLLDMVLLSGGIERSFERMLLNRGFQIRISPKGTLPFDTEAIISGAGDLIARLRRDPDVEVVAPVLGTSLHARRGDSLITLFGYGIDPAAQALYLLQQGSDLQPGDSAGLLVGDSLSRALRLHLGDTVRLVGRLDPEVARPAIERPSVVRGIVHWLYDYRGQPSVGAILPVVQSLSLSPVKDGISAAALRIRDGQAPDIAADRLARAFPEVEVTSVARLVAGFRARLNYFRQLSYILGTISLLVTLLLVSTLLTITVHERLGEIATLRAIGVSRTGIVCVITAEGALLTLAGGALGAILGSATASYLDRILTTFPGLPAAISFFVPDAGSLALAAVVLLAAGLGAGAYPAYLAARLPIALTLREEAT
jgi:putative ABC transport system permease protein